MAVSKKIFRRKDRKAWYCKHDGKFVNLGSDKAKAEERWHELCAHDEPGTVSTKVVLKRYLKWLKVNRAESSYTFAKRAIYGPAKPKDGKPQKVKWIGFGPKCGRVPAKSLRPHHLTEWADDNWGKASPNTRRKYMVTIQRAFSWALGQGLIHRNPFAKIEKPTQTHREDYVQSEDWPKLIEACTSPFDDMVRFTLLTGVRAQETVRIAAKHIGNKTIVLPIKDSKGEKKNRIIHLNGTAKALVTRLSKESPTGPIFCNADGKPWTKDSINCRMKRLKKKLDWPWLCLTVLRHSFAHAHVCSGTDALLLQSLMGHSDGRMLARVYAHADKATEALSNAADVTSHLLQTSGPSPTA